MIWLDRNENQFGPSPACYAALQETPRENLGGYSRDFLRGVKSTLSERLAARYGVPEPRVLLSYGSEDMLKQIVHCYLRPGETILVPRYSWWYYRSVAREVDGVTVQYPLRIADRSYEYDVSALDALIKLHQPCLVLIASPNNPTGNTLPDSDLIELLRLHPETRFVLDEAYHGFAGIEHDETPRLISLYPNIIVLRTFSKLYALASLRIGYAFAGSTYKKLTTYSARYLGYNTLSENIALAAMEDDPYYTRVGNLTAEENARYCEVLSNMPGVFAYRSQGNFILVRFPEYLIPTLRSKLSESGIAIKFFDEKDLQCCARITIGTPEQNTRLLEILQRCFT